jgi:hypothetical protein
MTRTYKQGYTQAEQDQHLIDIIHDEEFRTQFYYRNCKSINAGYKIEGRVSNCIRWNKAVNKQGYGQYAKGYMFQTTRTFLAHRLSWMLHHKSILPTALHILHLCDKDREYNVSRSCVNPFHLLATTNQYNNLDRTALYAGREAHEEFRALLLYNDPD